MKRSRKEKKEKMNARAAGCTSRVFDPLAETGVAGMLMVSKCPDLFSTASCKSKMPLMFSSGARDSLGDAQGGQGTSAQQGCSDLDSCSGGARSVKSRIYLLRIGVD